MHGLLITTDGSGALHVEDNGKEEIRTGLGHD